MTFPDSAERVDATEPRFSPQKHTGVNNYMLAASPSGKAHLMYDDITYYLGPPPLLKNEPTEKFRDFYVKLCCDLEPQDFLSHMLVYEVAIGTWGASRYKRYAAAILKRQEYEKRVATATKKKELAQTGNFFDRIEPDFTSRTEREIQESEALIEPAYQAEINAVPTDVDYAVLYDDSKCIEKLLRMSSAELKRSDDALRKLHWHNANLANRLRRISDGILDGELKMIDTSAEYTERTVPSEPQEVN